MNVCIYYIYMYVCRFVNCPDGNNKLHISIKAEKMESFFLF